MAARSVYEPLMPPADGMDVAQWALREFARLAEILNGGMDRIVLVPQAAAPPKPRAGMVANANGTNWNPGGGAGLYQFTAGGTWAKL